MTAPDTLPPSPPARRRTGPGSSGPAGWLPGALLPHALLLGTLVLALGACSPTVGEDGAFEQQPTTNTDFTLPATTIAVGNQPITMDVTLSGIVPDLIAVVNHVGGVFDTIGSVSILRNSPPGTIGTLQTITTLQFPSLALWADLDGANEQDLIVLDNVNERVAVYLSDGAGSWPSTATQEFAYITTVAQLTVVDLNADGFDDVVMTLPASDEIIALFNDTSGTLTEVPTPAVTGLGRFVAANLDGGTNVDLAVLRTTSNLLEIYNGVGDGTFDKTLPSTSIAVDSYTIDLVAGDLKGAGNVDLALLGETANADFTYVRLHANDGSGLFTLSGTTVLPTRGYRMFLTDALLAGSGEDVAVVHRNDRVLSFLGANGTAFDPTQLTTTRDPIDVVAGLVNADGNVDLVTAEDDRRTIGVFAGDGAGGFTRTQIGLTTHVVFPRLVDVDNDGLLDLITLQPYQDRLAVFINAN